MQSYNSGNCAVIKPSEVSPHTAEVLNDVVPRYLDNVSNKLGCENFIFFNTLKIKKALAINI